MKTNKRFINEVLDGMTANDAKYLLDCASSALAYSKSQFLDSGIDWLPSITFVSTQLKEEDKFDLAQAFIERLRSIY